jgi:hypothetical protein
MAWNFKTRIIDLAGDPSDDDAVQQWLVEGCHDVFRRAVKAFGPSIRHKFAIQSTNIVNGTAVEIDEVYEIVGVERNGVVATEADWDKKDKYIDSGSIYYAIATSPIYLISNKTLDIFPDCSGGQVGNYYYIPLYALTSWAADTSSIDGFPAEYYDAVTLYASTKVVQRKLKDVTVPTALTTLSITSVPPDEPSLATINYTPPTAATVTETADISVADIVAVTNASVSSITGASSNQPTYVAPAPPDRPDFEGSVTAEDEDILQMKVQQYQADLNEYQASIGDSVNEFQENVAIYNQLVAQATQNANATNQANIQNMQKDLQINQANNQKLIQQAQTNQQEEIQRNLQNASNAQAKAMQDAIQQVQDTIANNQSLLNEFQAKIGAYQAEVGTEVQEFTNNLSKFNADLQSKTTDYQWLEAQYAKLQGEYLSFFQTPAEEG